MALIVDDQVQGFEVPRVGKRHREESHYRPSAPRAESSYAYFVRPKSKQEAGSHLYVEMPPSKFLRMAVGGVDVYKAYKTSLRKHESVDYYSCSRLIELIKGRRPIDLPNLWVRWTDCQVLAHEGRHRATAARVCGVKSLPVLFHCRDEYFRPVPWEKCFKCQKPKRLKSQKTWSHQGGAYEGEQYGGLDPAP